MKQNGGVVIHHYNARRASDTSYGTSWGESWSVYVWGIGDIASCTSLEAAEAATRLYETKGGGSPWRIKSCHPSCLL